GWKGVRGRGTRGKGRAASRASGRIGKLARPAKRRSLSLWMVGAVLVDEMADVHKKYKGITMPEFQVSCEIARFLSPSRTELHEPNSPQPCRPYSSPVHRNGEEQCRKCHGRRQPRSWQVVFKREPPKTQPPE